MVLANPGGIAFIGRRAELERLRRAVEPRGLRGIPVLVGPSGIGKTRLARRVGEELSPQEYIYTYIRFDYVVTSIEELGNVLRRTLEDLRQRLVRVLGELVKSVAEKYLPGSSQALTPIREPLDLVKDLFEGLASAAGEKNAKVIVVLDEAQNLVNGLGLGVRGFVKILAQLQEDYPGVFQSLIVTSDYSFQRTLYREAPSLDYLDTFYLGEMTRRDAEELARLLTGQAPGQELSEFLESVGGHPYHVLRLASSSNWRVEHRRQVRKYRQRIAELLHGLGDAGADLRDLLEELVENPVPFERYLNALTSDKVRQAAETLVRDGVLQYACSEYVGIYSWNPDCNDQEREECGGGGLCGGFDVVAPASRIALAALTDSLEREDESTWF